MTVLLRRSPLLTVAAPLLVLLAAVAMWYKPWLMPGRLATEADIFYLQMPAWSFARTELLAGRMPLWNPYKLMGVPFLANLMVPVCYPLQALALLLPVPFAISAAVAGHTLLAGVGTYLAGRRAFGLARGPALLAGLTLMLSAPFMMHRSHTNQVFAMAWLPWVALLAWQPLPRGGAALAGHAGLLGLVLGMLLLAGQPQIAFYAAIVLGIGVLGWALAEPRRAGAALAVALVGGVLGLMISAVHLLPARELLEYSHRRFRDDDFSASFFLPWENLLTLLIPDWLGTPGTGGYRGQWNFPETAVFVGQPAVLLALWAVGRALVRREALRPLASALALVLLGTLLALGPQTPLFRWLIELIGPLRDFRAPARAFLLAALGLALLAGAGTQALLVGRKARVRRRVLGLLLLAQVASLAWFRWAYDDLPTTPLADFRRGIDASLPSPAAGQFGRLFHLVTEVDYTDSSPASLERGLWVLQPDLNMLDGIAVWGGYDEGMLPTRFLIMVVYHFWRNIYYADPDPWLLGLMDVRWMLTERPIFSSRWQTVTTQAAQASAYPSRILLNPQWRGPLFTRADWPEVDFERLKLPEAVTRATAPRDLLRAPVAASSFAGAARPASSLSFTREAPSRYRVTLAPGAPHEVIFSTMWLPGWWAELPDGRRVAGRSLGGFLTAFDLPADVDRCEIYYRPLSFVRGRWISCAGAAGVLALLLVGWGGARRRARAARLQAPRESDTIAIA